MNLRILKKLSKRSVPYLSKIGDTREVFFAQKGDNYHGLIVKDMTRLDRNCASHVWVGDEGTYVKAITPKCRVGTPHPYVILRYPAHPLKGTPMVGGMSGYYEPEWDEMTAWEALSSWVWGQFFEYDQENAVAYYSRSFRSPREIFMAADELLSEIY